MWAWMGANQLNDVELVVVVTNVCLVQRALPARDQRCSGQRARRVYRSRPRGLGRHIRARGCRPDSAQGSRTHATAITWEREAEGGCRVRRPWHSELGTQDFSCRIGVSFRLASKCGLRRARPEHRP